MPLAPVLVLNQLPDLGWGGSFSVPQVELARTVRGFHGVLPSVGCGHPDHQADLNPELVFF